MIRKTIIFLLIIFIIAGAVVSTAVFKYPRYVKKAYCLVSGHKWQRCSDKEWHWAYSDAKDERFPNGYEYRYKDNFIRCKHCGTYLFNLPYVDPDVFASSGRSTGSGNKVLKDIKKTSDGRLKTYYPGGRIKSEYRYADNKLNGIFTEYYPDGTLKSQWYCRNDKIHGNAEFFFPDGKTMWKGYFLMGKLHGPNIEYFANGNVKRRDGFYLGENHGVSRLYYDNGQLRWQRHFNHAQRQGPAVEYYPDGGLFREGSFHADHGTFKEYAKDGTLKREVIFDNGKLTYKTGSDDPV